MYMKKSTIYYACFWHSCCLLTNPGGRRIFGRTGGFRYASAVRYVYAEVLMNGIGDGLFAPVLELNRAMAITVLHRMAGSPEARSSVSFKDIPESGFYADAVNWGYEAGIIHGTGATTFTPDRSITREEMVTLFYRYAVYTGMDTNTSADLSCYTDIALVSGYTGDAFRWAVDTGLVNGESDTRLNPRGTANRAQFAVILYRFAIPGNDSLVLYLRALDGVATDLVM